MEPMILSVCIPTVVGREAEFERLSSEIRSQIAGIEDQVEIIFVRDNKGMTVGRKRQMLADMAKGKYQVQLDDDDMVPPYYIQMVLAALHNDPTHVGYLEKCYFDGREEIAHHSDRWKEWATNFGGYNYVRTIYNKDVILSNIVRHVKYNNLRFGEDHDFSIRLKKSGLLTKEEFIDEVMYIYTYNSMPEDEHNARYGIKTKK
jgi:GT2 family glycosyltransferase